MFNKIWRPFSSASCSSLSLRPALCVGKHLYDAFPVRNGLKKGNVLSPLAFNFAFEYAIKKVQDDQSVLELNETSGSDLCC
jgi:hypothetical protein